jgi:hypothetical protein
MNISFPLLSESVLTSIVDDMNRRGFGVARNCISIDYITDIQILIEERVANNGGEYIFFSGTESISGTFLERLASLPEFIHVCKAIYEKGTGQPAPNVPFYTSLRCLSGETGKNESLIFHYDSYVLTVLIPLIMPSEGKLGDLLILPNTRKLRKSYFRNLIDKVLLDNMLTQACLKKLTSLGQLHSNKVRLQPGNIYFFWGCRSIHANESCDPSKIRATAIFHYVDPHASSWLRGMLRSKSMQYKY